MSNSNYTLNQRISNLQTEINEIISGVIPVPTPSTSTLDVVLTNGNSAGNNDIDMNQQDIVNGNEIFLGSNNNSIEINGGGTTITITDNFGNQNVITAIGSSVPSANADSILTSIGSINATFYPAFIGATSGYNSVGVSTSLTYNPFTKTETITDGINSSIITPTNITSTNFNGALNGNSTSATKATNISGGIASQIPYQTGANTTSFISNGTSGQYLQSNGTSPPSWEAIPVIPTPNLQSVLDAGNSATDTNIQLISTSGFTPITTLNGTGMSIVDSDDNSATYGVGKISLKNNVETQEIILTANINPPTIFIQNNGGDYTSTLSATTLSAYDTGDTQTASLADIIGVANSTYDLQATLTRGNQATDKDIILKMTATSVDNTGLILIDDNASPTETTKLFPTSIKYDDTFTTSTASWLDIINSANAGMPNLQQVLNVGSGATSDITLNNNGAGSNYIRLLPNDSASNPAITLTDGTTTNKIDKNGYTTRNTTANLTHYLNFSDSSSTGTGAIQKTSGIECNPSTKTITATTFSGTATNATNISAPTTTTNAIYYPVFVSTSSGNTPPQTATALKYNPSTSTLTSQIFFASTGGTQFSTLDNTKLELKNVPSSTATLTSASLTINQITLNNSASASSDAGRFGQIGLVKLSSTQVSITGSASAQNLSFANLFNTTYKNYRIILHPTAQYSFAQYPSYALQAFLGTSVPTTASLYGFEITSSASSVVSPVYNSGATLSSSPLVFAVSSTQNKEIIFDIQNVGYTATSSQQVSLMCKSVYGNPGVSGASDRTISATALTNALITGLTIQQSAIQSPNNMTLEMVVYGYNNL